MGYSLCWAAVRGKSRETVLGELGFRETRDHKQIAESPFAGAQLADGWYLVTDYDHVRLSDEVVLARLASGAELVACALDDHSMSSCASGWRDGVKLWSVSHDPAQSIEHLETTGDLPDAFAAIRKRLFAKQRRARGRRVDYVYDVPAQLGRALTGFIHDLDAEDDLEFETLEPTASASAGRGRSVPAPFSVTVRWGRDR